MADPAGDGDRLPLKMCLISIKGAGARYGLAAPTLLDLQRKVLEHMPSQETITLVLEEDGTIVDDEDYFQCLPSNTKLVAVDRNQKWSPTWKGGLGFISHQAEVPIAFSDEPDTSAFPRWKQLASQLRGDLSQIILLSDEDLQLLTDTPCEELAEEMADSPCKVRNLQDTLQRLLDRREDERQSKQLLQLYLEALKGEGTGEHVEKGFAVQQATDEVDMSCRGSGSAGISHHIHLDRQTLCLLKEKSSPEISLSNRQLEAVAQEDTDALALALSLDKPKVQALKQACQHEMSQRVQQVQTLHSLSSLSKDKSARPQGHRPPAKRRK